MGLFNFSSRTLVSLDARRCATCRWWPGEREIKFMSQRPYKVQATGNAICEARGTRCSGNNSCSRWSKSFWIP